jgi:hypothetical protein
MGDLGLGLGQGEGQTTALFNEAFAEDLLSISTWASAALERVHFGPYRAGDLSEFEDMERNRHAGGAQFRTGDEACRCNILVVTVGKQLSYVNVFSFSRYDRTRVTFQ